MNKYLNQDSWGQREEEKSRQNIQCLKRKIVFISLQFPQSEKTTTEGPQNPNDMIRKYSHWDTMWSNSQKYNSKRILKFKS